MMIILAALLAVLAAVILLVSFENLRRVFISSWAIRLAARALPTIGETERVALEAGTVWWEGELFSGKPDWKKLLDFKIKPLNAEEKAFLKGPVNKLCAMLNDDEIQQRRDLPLAAWKFIKESRMLGMIIPKEYGGLGFSAAAHSAVITQIASRSVAAAVTVMVPNSLGPGELLLRYGTEKQKKHYLPRLARGHDVPCFALTEPTAGSDAASGQSIGVVTRGKWEGKEVLGISLTFNKRYITLAPVATVVGLAFRLHDPKHLLGDVEDIGITCALLPRNTPGLVIGKRHDPMGVPFQNGPVQGKNVFVPLEFIIGGPAYAGQGWRMLMEALAAGRGISLPSLSVGAAELSVRAGTAYAAVREQFGLPVGRFEGVRERLAQLAMNAYFMNAARLFTCGAVDAGEHPSVASAIAKAYLTEGMRQSLNNAMDIVAGAAICRGPQNIFANAYSSIPIGITVEGSNILTRSLIVFGQGAMRCHPYLQAEVEAIARNDVHAFDAAFFGHIKHVVKNALRSLALALGGGLLARVPAKNVHGSYFRKLSRYAAAFAFLADVGLVTLGGSLKRREYLSGRYADALAWLYLASATLKYTHHNPQPHTQALLELTLGHALLQVQNALAGVLANLPNRWVACVASWVVFPLGLGRKPAGDKLTDRVVEELLAADDTLRRFLARDIYVPAATEPGLGLLEQALAQTRATQAIRKKMADAVRTRKLAKARPEEMAQSAFKQGLINKSELAELQKSEELRNAAIQVNFFDPDDFAGRR